MQTHLRKSGGVEERSNQARTIEDIPQGALDYVQYIEKLVGIPVEIISVGPDREQTIFLK